MTKFSNKMLRTVWRRRLFVAWVAMGIGAAFFVGAVAPFIESAGEGWGYAAIPVLALNFLFAATAAVWLAALTMTRPKRVNHALDRNSQ